MRREEYCPYFESSHSEMVLSYTCNAVPGKMNINADEIDAYPCWSPGYVNCKYYKSDLVTD